jgi:hypothetical protein
MNTSIFNYLVDNYNKLSYTHNYIFGFEFNHTIYMAHADAEVLPYVLTLDKASRGAGYSIRFKPNKNQKMVLITKAEVLCSAEYFNSEVNESKYNAGEIFEKMVTEKYGQVWEKDNIPFTEDGDLTVDGIAYQIKFNKATFINEKSLARFLTM